MPVVKIYTKTGDRGETSLFGGTRIAKNDPRIDAYGTVDELNSSIGAARASWPASPLDHELHHIQSDLFDIGAHLASVDATRFAGVEQSRIGALEQAIDLMEAELPPLKNFILPGGSPNAAALHLARTVCRRAERLVVALGDQSTTGATTVMYLNRLSDYLFVAARFANRRMGIADVEWKR